MVYPQVGAVTGANAYQIHVRPKNADESSNQFDTYFGNTEAIAFGTVNLEPGSYVLEVYAIQEDWYGESEDVYSPSTDLSFTVTKAADNAFNFAASWTSYGIQDGTFLSICAPGSDRTAIYVEDGTSFTRQRDQVYGWYYGAPGTHTAYAEAYYPDGTYRKSDPITLTATTDGELAGVKITNTPLNSVDKGADYTLRYGQASNYSGTVLYILNIYDTYDSFNLVYHKTQSSGTAFTVDTGDEAFVPGHVYRVNYIAYAPGKQYAIWREEQGFTVLDPDAEKTVRLTLDGSTKAQKAQTWQDVTFVVTAPGASMLRIRDNYEDDHSFDYDPDMLDANGCFTYAWQTRQYAQTLVVWAEACFDENPWAEDARWYSSNSIFLQVEAQGGLFPVPELETASTVIAGRDVTVTLKNIPDGAEELFFGISSAKIDDDWQDGTWTYSIADIKANNNQFTYSTGGLEPGVNYRYYASYFGAGYANNGTYRWLRVEPSPTAPATPSFTLEADSLTRGENVVVTVEKAENLLYAYVTLTNKESGHANGRAGTAQLPVIFGTSRLEAGEYEVKVVGYNKSDEPGPASYGTVIIAEPVGEPEWVIDANVPNGGTYNYNERIWSSWYAPGAEHIVVYWNNGDVWDWDGAGIWGWARQEEDGELTAYAIATYPDGSTKTSETYRWTQVSAGSITGAAVQVPGDVALGEDVTIPYTAASNKGLSMVYELTLYDRDEDDNPIYYDLHSAADGNELAPFTVPAASLRPGHRYLVELFASDEGMQYIPLVDYGEFQLPFLGRLRSPIARVSDTVYEGKLPTVTITDADERIEWSVLEVWNNDTDEQLLRWDMGTNLNGNWALGDTGVTVEAGSSYSINIYSGKDGYDGGHTYLSFTPVKQHTVGMSLTVNDSAQPDPILVNTSFSVQVSAPADATLVLFYDGDGWNEIYNVLWQDGSDPTNLSVTRQHGGSGSKYMLAKATSDSLAGGYDWNSLNWTVYSNAVVLPISALDTAGRPGLSLLADSVAQGEGLPIAITGAEHASQYFVQIKQANENRDHIAQYVVMPGESLLPTADLEPGQAYYLHLGASGQAGYEDRWFDWDEMLNYRFTVTEAEATSGLRFVLGTTSPLIGQNIPFSIVAPDAVQISLYEGDSLQQRFAGDTVSGETWCWQQDSSLQYLEAVAVYPSGSELRERVNLNPRVLGALPEVNVRFNPSLLAGDSLDLFFGIENYSDNIHVWVYNREDCLLDNYMLSSGSGVTVPGMQDGLFTIHVQAYGEWGYTPTSQDYHGWVLAGNEPRLIFPAAISSVEDEAFRGDASIEWAVVAQGSIGSKAFADCENLRFLELGTGVTKIADDALSGSPFAVVLTPKGSYADQWAQNHGIGVRYTN